MGTGQEGGVNSKAYRRGDVIYSAGDRPAGLYFINKGLVGLVIQTPEGKEHLVRLFKCDHYFGHRSYFAEEKYHATARALEEVVVTFYPREAIEEKLKTDPKFVRQLLKTLAVELKMAEMKIVSLSEKEVAGRIAEALIYLKELFPNHYWTRQEIADFCGSTAPTVIRTLSQFESEGWIRQQGREIQIVDKTRLLELS